MFNEAVLFLGKAVEQGKVMLRLCGLALYVRLKGMWCIITCKSGKDGWGLIQPQEGETESKGTCMS